MRKPKRCAAKLRLNNFCKNHNKGPQNGAFVNYNIWKAHFNLKTPGGFETFAELAIGINRDAAYLLFDSLEGNKTIDSNAILHIDLMEATPQVPEKMLTKGCMLDQLARNIRLITREVFRQKNLKIYEM